MLNYVEGLRHIFEERNNPSLCATDQLIVIDCNFSRRGDAPLAIRLIITIMISTLLLLLIIIIIIVIVILMIMILVI